MISHGLLTWHPGRDGCDQDFSASQGCGCIYTLFPTIFARTYIFAAGNDFLICSATPLISTKNMPNPTKYKLHVYDTDTKQTKIRYVCTQKNTHTHQIEKPRIMAPCAYFIQRERAAIAPSLIGLEHATTVVPSTTGLNLGTHIYTARCDSVVSVSFITKKIASNQGVIRTAPPQPLCASIDQFGERISYKILGGSQ